MVVRLSSFPERIRAILLRKHYFIPCALPACYLKLKETATATENPQNPPYFSTSKMPTKTLTYRKKEKKGNGEGIEKRPSCKTNKPNFPRDPKKMPIISPHKERKTKGIPIFGFGQTRVPLPTPTPISPSIRQQDGSNSITGPPLAFCRL